MKMQDRIERPKPVSELVRDQLRADIISGRLALGAKVSEAQLSDLYGVTKAPIRSAFIRLEAEGLLSIRPQVGTFVFSPTADEVQALCEYRTALELEALTLAMARDADALVSEVQTICERMKKALADGAFRTYQELDTRLHLAIISHAQSPLLAETYTAGISSRFAALRGRFSKHDAHVDASSSEHYAICAAIAEARLDEARDLLRQHIDNTRCYFAKLIGN